MSSQEVVYDKKEQLEKIWDWILPGETLYVVYDCKGVGTGFLAITDRRLIFYDKQFMRKKKAMVSVPYGQIAAVSSEDEGGLLTGRGFFSSSKIGIHTTGNAYYDFEFRGADKAHNAYCLIVPHLK
jgi:hypothetical protein